MIGLSDHLDGSKYSLLSGLPLAYVEYRIVESTIKEKVMRPTYRAPSVITNSCTIISKALLQGLNQASLLLLDDAASYRDIRERIRFDRFTACWGCGQPPFMCPNRSCACEGSPLIWKICWTLAYLDIHHGSDIVLLLGGVLLLPLVCRPAAPIAYEGFWVGKMMHLFAQQALQAARFTYQWLDSPRVSHPLFDFVLPQRPLTPLALKFSCSLAPSFRPYCGRCPFYIHDQPLSHRAPVHHHRQRFRRLN